MPSRGLQDSREEAGLAENFPGTNGQPARLGQLLDHALDLPLPKLEPWLADLARAEPELAARLRAVLATRDAPGFAGFMSGSALNQTRSGHAAGDRLGAYELLRPLGSGGMAEVWLARRADGAFERQVALKIPHMAHVAQGMIERFSRECRILATLETPGIARLYDAGVDAGVPYLAMEYVSGEQINEWCESRGLATPTRITLFLQVLEAVGKAHAQQVIHRDLKPSNILVNAEGEVRLLDFGVARLLAADTNGSTLTHAYGRALTPAYASPELLRGEPIDARSDIYSAGVVLFELLTGTRPGTRTVVASTVAGSLSTGLRAVLEKALAQSPEDRYPDAAAFAAALQSHAALSRSQARRRRWLIAAAALAALGAGFWYFQRGAMPLATASVTAPPALAVLPFADLSQARDHEYLADGLAEEILNQLAQLQSLRLVARTSSFSFKGKNEDLRIIGQKLGVTHLLEGSVRKDGDQLRITAQLIRADDGTHLWSKTYAREFKDVLVVEDEISRDVATALSIKLEVGDLTRAAGGTTHIQAYEKFLQARAELAREGDWRIASQLLREAVALDPDFGVAWAQLARTLYGGQRSTAPNDPAGREIAEIVARNTTVAPTAPWTLQLQANDHIAHHRWAQAEAAMQAVFSTQYGARPVVEMETNPAVYLKWVWLFNVGRVTESLRMNAEWARTDPLGVWASTNYLYQLPYGGRDTEMPAEYARNSQLAGGNTSHYTEWSMLFHLLRGSNASPAAIRAQLVKLNHTDGDRRDSLERKVLDNLGNPDALRAVLRGELQAPRSQYSFGDVAAFADAFGERDLALAAIRKEVLDPVVYTPYRLPWVLWYPYRTGLRADPRFKDILREAGLVDYWRKTSNWGDFCKPVGADDFECS